MWNLENDLSIKELITEGKVVSDGIFKKVIKEFFNKPMLHKLNKIFLLYVFELWYREWFYENFVNARL
jgi:hypothetical protein